MDKNEWNMKYSWTQPLANFSFNPFYERAKDLAAEEEIDRLEMVDRWVDSMLTFPDAEAILNKIMEEGKNYD